MLFLYSSYMYSKCIEGTNLETISEKLKLLRTKMGLTQFDVANALGVERSTYTYYELGKTLPDWQTIKKLAKIFNVDYYDLLEDHGKYVLQDYHNNFQRINICDLSPEERRLILLMRTVSDEKKKEIIESIEKKLKKL